ncbi:MAG: DUF983 domain-containing protein [Bacteroidia bacterium]|nr:DUF983 domain-containing protein [Bacteroidia bacterium]
MIIPQLIYSTITNKCPRCHQGKIFESNNPYTFNKPLLMRDSCSECALRYEREPGFFYGAMYVSYAIMSGIFIMWFLADIMWLHMTPLFLGLLVTLNMALLFPVVYRSARIIWLNFFVRFDKNYSLRSKVLDSINESKSIIKSN